MKGVVQYSGVRVLRLQEERDSYEVLPRTGGREGTRGGKLTGEASDFG